ncbi:MAG: sigma-70 family RNA polymerase sigma factor [Clostridia bacterium]|nr:sigma-70 family RNA polymerase sigma factor [Clostridia bacterium]MBR5746992.1 sigma-70 family RNA polymerase sigma factor [Clostridia bacterium]
MPSDSSLTKRIADEELLVASARKGDERAFEALAEAYKRVLEFHVRRVAPPDSLYDDLFQEGLIGLLKAVRRYDGKSSSFATFASLCIRNSILTGARKYKAQAGSINPGVPGPEREETVPSAEETMLDGIRAKELYDKVLSALSPYEKLVFDMYLKDISYESMSFVLGKDVRSVENAVYRIRNKLKTIVRAAGSPD